jgi:hypothetical protein
MGSDLIADFTGKQKLVDDSKSVAELQSLYDVGSSQQVETTVR